MPVSHIGLTVSHLPASTSFFLSALQPLGYRYIGESGSQIGLGIRDADFFLCQETPGIKAGAAHIAFTAPSRTAVRDFYTAALTAGGKPNGAPATRCAEDDHFNAAVLDLDGNSIEVVYRNGPDIRDDGTVIEHSRVIKWQRSIHETYGSYRDDRSVVSSRTSASKAAASEAGSVAPSVAPSAASKAPSVAPSVAPSAAPSAASRAGSLARSVSEPTNIPQAAAASNNGDGAAKAIIGTLLGAAAGAAVAYAMVRSEKDSAKKESDFSAFMDVKNTVKAAAGILAQASSQPKQPTPDPQPVIEPAAIVVEPVHRYIETQSYHSSATSQPRSECAPRQIEAAPASYYAPSQAPTHISAVKAIEYAPAASVASSSGRSKLARSVTSPEILTIEKARSVASTVKPRSVVSKAHSVAPSAAPSSLISSFVPDQPTRHVSEGSVASHHSSKSKARSSHSKSSRSRHDEEAIESSPSPPPSMVRTVAKYPSRAASMVSSVLGRNASKHADSDNDLIDELRFDDLDDLETVVPSDSVSQIGSSSSRRHRKKHSDKSSSADSTVSKSSSSSKHSKHSHRSHRSHKSKSHDHSDDDAASTHSSESKHSSASKSRRKHHASVVSEPSDTSTVKPTKKSSSRKDSVTQGQYDTLFEDVQYGTGTVPVRGITESMVSAARKNPTRTMVNYEMAQKIKAFE